MKKIDRKTEKYLKELFNGIKIPNFKVFFDFNVAKSKPIYKKLGFFEKLLVLKNLPSFLCVALIILTMSFIPFTRITIPGNGGEGDIIEEPEISYYVNQLEQVKIDLADAVFLADSKDYIFPSLIHKTEILIYKFVVTGQDKTLGLNISFTYMDESTMYLGTVRILDKTVKDAMDRLPDVANILHHNDLDIKYSFPDFDGMWYIYSAWFESESTSYLITYQSFMEDIEQGIATIF